MSSGVERCQRCRRRWRGQADWNDVYIAGFLVARLCPGCQTVEENLEAEINLLGSPLTAVDPSTSEGFAKMIEGWIRTYRTPEVLRDKADQLSTARRDASAQEAAQMMRQVADDIEAGVIGPDSP